MGAVARAFGGGAIEADEGGGGWGAGAGLLVQTYKCCFASAKVYVLLYQYKRTKADAGVEGPQAGAAGVAGVDSRAAVGRLVRVMYTAHVVQQLVALYDAVASTSTWCV